MTEATDHFSYVRKCYHALTPEERARFCNGVGSEIPQLEWADSLIPAKWKRRMRAEADYHDVGYWIGGSRDHRYDCDRGTYEGWKTMVGALPDRLERAEGYTVMWIAYRVLRVFGWLSFDFRDEPWSLQMLKDFAAQNPKKESMNRKDRPSKELRATARL